MYTCTAPIRVGFVRQQNYGSVQQYCNSCEMMFKLQNNESGMVVDRRLIRPDFHKEKRPNFRTQFVLHRINSHAISPVHSEQYYHKEGVWLCTTAAAAVLYLQRGGCNAGWLPNQYVLPSCFSHSSSRPEFSFLVDGFVTTFSVRFPPTGAGGVSLLLTLDGKTVSLGSIHQGILRLNIL